MIAPILVINAYLSVPFDLGDDATLHRPRQLDPSTAGRDGGRRLIGAITFKVSDDRVIQAAEKNLLHAICAQQDSMGNYPTNPADQITRRPALMIDVS